MVFRVIRAIPQTFFVDKFRGHMPGIGFRVIFIIMPCAGVRASHFQFSGQFILEIFGVDVEGFQTSWDWPVTVGVKFQVGPAEGLGFWGRSKTIRNILRFTFSTIINTQFFHSIPESARIYA